MQYITTRKVEYQMTKFTLLVITFVGTFLGTIGAIIYNDLVEPSRNSTMVVYYRPLPSFSLSILNPLKHNFNKDDKLNLLVIKNTGEKGAHDINFRIPKQDEELSADIQWLHIKSPLLHCEEKAGGVNYKYIEIWCRELPPRGFVTIFLLTNKSVNLKLSGTFKNDNGNFDDIKNLSQPKPWIKNIIIAILAMISGVTLTLILIIKLRKPPQKETASITKYYNSYFTRRGRRH